MANTKFSRQNSLTGFVSNKTPPPEYTVRQANRMLIVRNADPADTRRNFKQHKYQVDWIQIQESEILLCFPNRQELVNFCISHESHHFGTKAGFFIPPPATKPEPWTLTKNKTYPNQGLFSDSDSETDSADFVTQTSKKKQYENHKIEKLFDSNKPTNVNPTPHKPNATQNKQTQSSNSNTNTNSEHNTQKHTSDTTLQILNHTEKSNNPFYIKTLATQLNIQTPKTFWSEKNKITTLLFKSQTELNTFRTQIQENTFGVYAKYIRPQSRNTEPTQTQVAREANVVALGVNPDIDVKDIESELTELHVDISRVTRIRNSQGNTHLIRIFSRNTNTIKTLLTQGLYLANRRYKVVPPKDDIRHTPCRRCQQYGHTQQTCTNPAKCFRCGTLNNQCSHTPLEARAIYCATCNSPDHFTGQMKCPLYPRDTPPQLPLNTHH